jgi:all-trans-8'-apo-beta-carotenal 15,15'-oxygenase
MVMSADPRPDSSSETPPPTRSRRAAAAWYRSLQDLPREHGFESLRVEGKIPDDLCGTLYRNGAALLTQQGQRCSHWFDGDGGVSAVRFGNGQAQGASRVVMSRGLTEERKAGKALYGGFGTVQPGFFNRVRGVLKNSANTSVMFWNDRLFAMIEACLPTELSPDDLTTIGETDLGGVIPFAFSAHPHAVPARNAIYNFGVRYGLKTYLDCFELPEPKTEGGQGSRKARLLASVPLKGAPFIHDFIATERHLVFFVPPARVDIVPMLLGRGSVADNLKWRPESGTEVIIVPIDTPDRVTRFKVDPFFQWHFANAFERQGEIVVDFIRYDDLHTLGWLTDLFRGGNAVTPRSTYHRAVIDPSTSRARRFRDECLWDRTSEFPRISPANEGNEYSIAYAAGYSPRSESAGLQDSVSRIDVNKGVASEFILDSEQFTGEPIFVPKANARGEGEGYLLSAIYDARTHSSHCAVFDAEHVDAGPLARAHMDHHIPPRFHGVWRPATTPEHGSGA